MQPLDVGAGHPQVLFQMIGAQLETNIQRRLDTETATDGAPWPPLADSTKSRYANPYGGSAPGSLLERTHQMHNLITANAVEVGFSRLTTNREHSIAALHELGMRHMPRLQLLTDDPIAGSWRARASSACCWASWTHCSNSPRR